MNFFEFYEIPISFKVDEDALRTIFYSNSKKYHPDFYTLESDEKQAEILELSTLNNEAYKTLTDFDKRMKYILKLKGVMEATIPTGTCDVLHSTPWLTCWISSFDS